MLWSFVPYPSSVDSELFGVPERRARIHESIRGFVARAMNFGKAWKSMFVARALRRYFAGSMIICVFGGWPACWVAEVRGKLHSKASRAVQWDD